MKHFSFIAENLRPLSQNSRSSTDLEKFRFQLLYAYFNKFTSETLPLNPFLKDSLEAKAFYIHKVKDRFDADNISKPLWDALNKHAYKDDRQIKYLETLKIDTNTPDIFELDITDIEIDDLNKILDFLFDTSGLKERILYVALTDYESKNVRIK